jgi:RNA polymerase sigma factor (sigma-70 family)
MQSVGNAVVQETAARAVMPSRRLPSTGRRRAPEDPASSLFCLHHALIQDVVRRVIRRRRLKYQDAEDFTGTVLVRLLEDDCAVLRRFEGRSSVRTFLARVIDRMLLDYRIEQWGKWRPSARARRLGKVAIQLETLIARDGLTFAEAAESLRTNYLVDQTVDELWVLNAQLPPRHRRRVVPCRQLESLPATGYSPEEIVSRPGSRALEALRVALATLSADDRNLITQRFERDLRLAQLAELRGVPQKQFYRDFSALLRQIRARLEEQGVHASDVMTWLGRPETPSSTCAVLPFRHSSEQTQRETRI